MKKRYPKRGFRANRFNNMKTLAQLNLGKLAYHIKKGDIDATKTITMRDLLRAGACSKIQYGVKLLSKGADKLKELGIPINMEISDASKGAIDTVKESGGSLKVKYRTPLLMRYHVKPHKF